MKKLNIILILNVFFSIILLPIKIFSIVKFSIESCDENLYYNNPCKFKLSAISDQDITINSLNFKIISENSSFFIKKYIKSSIFYYKINDKNQIDAEIKTKNNKKQKLSLKKDEKQEVFNFALKIPKTIKDNKLKTTCNLSFLDDSENNKNEILENYFSLNEPNIYLKKIIPTIGKLNPEFLPKVLKYNLEVDSQIECIDFELKDNGDQKIKINRKKLKKKGKTTNIKIKVKDLKTKFEQIYQIDVLRKNEEFNGLDISKKKDKKPKEMKINSKKNKKNVDDLNKDEVNYTHVNDKLIKSNISYPILTKTRDDYFFFFRLIIVTIFFISILYFMLIKLTKPYVFTKK